MSNPNVSLEKVDSMVPIQDIVACVEKGRSLSEIINNLKEDEDFKQFPRLVSIPNSNSFIIIMYGCGQI